MKIVEKLVAALFWLQIAAAPSVLAVFLGIVAHYYLPNPLGWIVAIAIGMDSCYCHRGIRHYRWYLVGKLGRQKIRHHRIYF